MTRNEFFSRVNNLFEEHPMIAKSKRKTLNEFLYVLRMDKEYDYCVSLTDTSNEHTWTCIPSAKECFVPVRDLKKHVKSIDFDTMEHNGKLVCMSMVVEK